VKGIHPGLYAQVQAILRSASASGGPPRARPSGSIQSGPSTPVNIRATTEQPPSPMRPGYVFQRTLSRCA
jgi:hypothetical protein